jgi:hypothetical protein
LKAAAALGRMVVKPPPALLAKAVARVARLPRTRPLRVDDVDRTSSSPPLATW